MVAEMMQKYTFNQQMQNKLHGKHINNLNMSCIAENIKQRMSLREPLREALDVLVEVSDRLSLKKPPLRVENDSDTTEKAEAFLKEELEKVHELYPSCTNFEREFPSIAFSIATGVGKTRLMGACVAYLYLQHGIRDFFVLAPNLTIYNKLIDDFGNPGYPKYLFRGFAEFVNTQISIITGENYDQTRNLYADNEIRINVFNIAKFNSETRGTKQNGIAIAPRIKRLSEFLGQSYWKYLSDIENLVVLMDEAHRYHADSSKKAINNLRPILGLEMTATPTDEKGKLFKNVVYEYSLAQAIADGKYVKIPAVGTRQNFDPTVHSEKRIEEIKLEDAVTTHENTKQDLEIYARTTGKKLVKPFILVVCRDTTHSREVEEYLQSDDFFKGQYKDKVLRIDSTNKDDEVERQFLSLESTDNQIEIVVHVNMLKEGWDVTNLYTIVPLRAANASILIEQTIGRGLRLPYEGKRTGVEKVDMLTVLAHENFTKVIEASKDPNSILNKIKFINIDESCDFGKETTVITTQSVAIAKIEKQKQEIDKINNPIKRKEAENRIQAKRAAIEALSSFKGMRGVAKITDIVQTTEIRELFIAKTIEVIRKNNASNLFVEEIVAEAENAFVEFVEEKQLTEIEIPRITVCRTEPTAYFNDFDLDTIPFVNLKALDPKIYRQRLDDNKVDEIVVKENIKEIDPVKSILTSLIDFPEVDMDESAPLAYKLATQACESINARLESNEDLSKTIEDYKKYITEIIYNQMMAHFVIIEGNLLTKEVLPFIKIEPWNGKMLKEKGRLDYRELVNRASSIPMYVFNGFMKAGHEEYKFDSMTELDMACILENDKRVLKWLYPAPTQFNIVWNRQGSTYRPDFVVETPDTIYMLETKAKNEIIAEEVQLKKNAAEEYCRSATEYTLRNGGKPWKYAIISHDDVKRTYSLDYILARI